MVPTSRCLPSHHSAHCHSRACCTLPTCRGRPSHQLQGNSALKLWCGSLGTGSTGLYHPAWTKGQTTEGWPQGQQVPGPPGSGAALMWRDCLHPLGSDPRGSAGIGHGYQLGRVPVLAWPCPSCVTSGTHLNVFMRMLPQWVWLVDRKIRCTTFHPSQPLGRAKRSHPGMTWPWSNTPAFPGSLPSPRSQEGHKGMNLPPENQTQTLFSAALRIQLGY